MRELAIEPWYAGSERGASSEQECNTHISTIGMYTLSDAQRSSQELEDVMEVKFVEPLTVLCGIRRMAFHR